MSDDFAPSWTLHLILSWGGKSVRLTVVDNFQWHGSRCGLYTSTIITITTVNCKSLNITHHMLQPPESQPRAPDHFIWSNDWSRPMREQSGLHGEGGTNQEGEQVITVITSELCQIRPGWARKYKPPGWSDYQEWSIFMWLPNFPKKDFQMILFLFKSRESFFLFKILPSTILFYLIYSSHC